MMQASPSKGPPRPCHQVKMRCTADTVVGRSPYCPNSSRYDGPVACSMLSAEEYSLGSNCSTRFTMISADGRLSQGRHGRPF